MAFDFSTLVTDRQQSDVAYVKQLIARIVEGTATETDLVEWNSFTLKGSYNYTDLNRVTAAMDYLKEVLERVGYIVDGYRKYEVPHNNSTGDSASLNAYLWYEHDVPTPKLMSKYLENVSALRNVLTLPDKTPSTPVSLSKLTVKQANSIEQILLTCSEVFNSMLQVIPKASQPMLFCGFVMYVKSTVEIQVYRVFTADGIPVYTSDGNDVYTV